MKKSLMRYILFLFLALLSGHARAQKNTVKALDKTSFLRDILGARYSKSDRAWTLPPTEAVADTFGTSANGGLFVGVDTIVYRDVEGHKEAWVLFTVEGYLFNMARMTKTVLGWSVSNVRYRMHEGTHGHYAPLAFFIQMIGRKTFISVKEDRFGRGIIHTKWVLYDPLTFKKAGEMELATIGEKEQNPDQYTEIEFLQVKYESVQDPLPDIMLTQNLESKKKGEPARISSRTMRYRWDEKRSVFVKVGK